MMNSTANIIDKIFFQIKINVPAAWDVTKGNSTIKIDLIGQSGVKRDHPDLSSKIATGDDLGYTGSHEAYVAGVTGAATNNSLVCGRQNYSVACCG